MLDLSLFASPWKGVSPTKIIFGEGTLDQLGNVCAALGKSVLLVTSQSALKNGVVDRCRNLLEADGIRVEGYHEVTADPTVHQVNAVMALALQHGSDVLVAIGGGSSMDTAKAASVVTAKGGQAEDYITRGKATEQGSLPVVALPTTAGTGAELSQGAIISYPEKDLKGSIRGPAVMPNVALVDPTLTLSLPRDQIKITGFDCFAHAAETYISRKATPITAMYSAYAIQAVAHYLPVALDDPENMSARTQLSFYSMLMGYNLSNASTCLPHRLQYPLGIKTKTAHALGLATLYPAWVHTTRAAAQNKFAEVARWLTVGLDVEPSEDILTVLRKFMQRIDLTPTISDLGADEAMCTQMAGMVQGGLANDPWWQEGADLAAIYRLALDPIQL